MRKEGRNRVIMLNIFMSSSTVNWHIIPVVSMLLGGGSLFCYNKFVTVFEILSTFWKGAIFAVFFLISSPFLNSARHFHEWSALQPNTSLILHSPLSLEKKNLKEVGVIWDCLNLTRPPSKACLRKKLVNEWKHPLMVRVLLGRFGCYDRPWLRWVHPSLKATTTQIK